MQTTVGALAVAPAIPNARLCDFMGIDIACWEWPVMQRVWAVLALFHSAVVATA